MGVGESVAENTTNGIDYNPTHVYWEYIVDQAQNKYFSYILMYLKQFCEKQRIYYPPLYKRKQFPKKLNVFWGLWLCRRRAKTGQNPDFATPSSHKPSPHRNCAFSDENLWQRWSRWALVFSDCLMTWALEKPGLMWEIQLRGHQGPKKRGSREGRFVLQ